MLIKHLSFKFNKQSNQFFFRNLTIDFTPNKIHFIQGDNGVGKSTFFNILQGTTSKDAFLEASLQLDSTTLTTQAHGMPSAFTQQVHTVQQNYDSMIANQFTFMENLQLANLPRYPNVQPLPQVTLFDVIKTLEIDPHKPAYLLSGGQRQLLAILMAVQKTTKLLLLDEPTATLDKKNADLIMQCLFKLAQQLKMTMLIICHDKELVKQYAQGTSCIMRQVEDGTRVIEDLKL